MESSMDTFVLNEDNHKKWEELHAQSSKTETRLVPNDAVQKIFFFEKSNCYSKR